MTSVTMDSFKRNLSTYVEMAIRHNNTVTLTTNTGNAVLVNEDEYRGLLETRETKTK